MFNWIKKALFGVSLNDHISKPKKIRVNGVVFYIKKIDIMDHLEGSKVLTTTFRTYEQKKQELAEKDTKKIKSHFSDVFLAGVVKPILSRDGAGETIDVNEIFKDWDMAYKLYSEIQKHTHGKKKVKQIMLDTSLKQD